MAEIAPVRFDLNEELQEVLAETPWVEEKLVLFHKAMTEFGHKNGGGIVPVEVGYIGDTELKNSRIGVQFTSHKSLPVYQEHGDGYGHSGIVPAGSAIKGKAYALKGLKHSDLFRTENYLLLPIRDVAVKIARGAGELTLGLSKFDRRVA